MMKAYYSLISFKNTLFIFGLTSWCWILNSIYFEGGSRNRSRAHTHVQKQNRTRSQNQIRFTYCLLPTVTVLQSTSPPCQSPPHAISSPQWRRKSPSPEATHVTSAYTLFSSSTLPSKSLSLPPPPSYGNGFAPLSSSAEDILVALSSALVFSGLHPTLPPILSSSAWALAAWSSNFL